MKALPIYIAIVAAIAVGCVLYFTRDHVTSEFRAKATRAVDSLTRLQDASGDGAMWYQPRLIDTEKAVDEAKRSATTDSDTQAFDVLNRWFEMVKMDRSWKKTDADALALSTYGSAGYKDASAQAMARARTRENVLSACKAEVTAALNGTPHSAGCDWAAWNSPTTATTRQ